MGKKGGTMVEAALVFPIVILSLMGIIGILMFLFEDAACQAGLHQVIRTEAGRETGTFHGAAGSSNVDVDIRFHGMYRVVAGKATVTFEGWDMLPRMFQKPFYGYQYLTDERKYARYIDLFTMEEQHAREADNKNE